MPYKNIIYTKLRSELATDDRFTDKLDDCGKLVYMCLLLLAGVKENRIPDDENYLKRQLNLREKPEIIREKLDIIFKVFPKTISVNGIIKFKNYNKMHNPLGKSEGTPKVAPKDALYNIIEEYIKEKKYKEMDDPEIKNLFYRRNLRAAKNLWLLSKGDVGRVGEAIRWFSEICDKKGLSWTLETIEKWYPEFVVNGKGADLPESLKKYAR